MASMKPGIASVSSAITPSFRSTETTLPRTEYCFGVDAVVPVDVDFELGRHPHRQTIPQVNTQENTSELHRAERRDRVACIDVFVFAICDPLFVEQPGIAEMVTELAIEFARRVVVEPAKGEAVIQ